MSKKDMPPTDMFDSSSDDEAPDEVGVSATRQERVAQIKNLQNADRKKKEEEKERRRKRNEMFVLQKERKLQELSKRMLPQDVLEGIPAKSSKMMTSKKQEGTERDESVKAERAGSEGVDEENSGSDQDSVASDDEDEGFDEGAQDFISLRPSNLSVVTGNQLSQTRMSSVQAALSFKQNCLYNKAKIPRETTQERRSRAAKKRALHQR